MSGKGDRPTIQPPFDPAVFAQESERAMRAAVPRHDEGDRPTRPRGDALLSETRMALASRPMLEAGPELVPVIAASREDMDWFELDDASRALLAQVDGVAMLGEVLARAGDIPDAITVISELARQGIILFKR